MLAGYEGSMLCSCVRPAYGRTFSRPPAGGRAKCCSEQVSLQALQSFLSFILLKEQARKLLYSSF